MAKVLLINGSPHENGCVFTALSEVAGALHSAGLETQIYHIGTKPVMGCLGCRRCAQLGHCFYEEDCANEILSLALECEGIVIGAPVYYAGPCGQVCAIMDRVFFSSMGRFAGKVGACVVNCRRGGNSASFDRLNKYFTISRMPVVSSQYWNSTHGYTPRDVKKDLEGLQTMRTLGLNMAWMINSLAANAEQRPAPEPGIQTNFIS